MNNLNIPLPSKSAQETIEHLFMKGPIWDGDLISKEARNELFRMRFVDAIHGWNYLTTEGVLYAVKVLDLGAKKERRS